MSGEFHIEALLSPAAYPHPVARPVLRQTHMSWVLLTGPYAYKIKKPVRFGFADMSTLDRRHTLCQEELRLNRRFAPDLYLDVVPVTRDGGQLRIGGAGEVVEYAVRMHQFDPGQELAEQLARQAVGMQDMSAIAVLLADAHQAAGLAPQHGPHGGPLQLKQQVETTFTELMRHCQGPQRQLLDRLSHWTAASLVRLAPLISQRKSAGSVRECHGDLHARNIVRWRDHWLPFDCLEFDPALRYIDVLNDVSFLHMDLIAHGRRDLACGLLSHYLEITGDYDGMPLMPLYSAWRALVRCMVEALRADSAAADELQAIRTRMDRLLDTARQLAEPTPSLVIMHGVTACGKSWLGERLVPALHAIRIRSDLERKRLAGIAPLAHGQAGAAQGNYSEAFTQRTYERLLACAGAVLEGGCTAIIDASFLRARHRAAFRKLAEARRCRFVIAACHADAATLHARLQSRANEGTDPSEATPQVLEYQLRTREPLEAEELQQAVQIDTARPASVAAGIAALGARLA